MANIDNAVINENEGNAANLAALFHKGESKSQEENLSHRYDDGEHHPWPHSKLSPHAGLPSYSPGRGYRYCE